MSKKERKTVPSGNGSGKDNFVKMARKFKEDQSRRREKWLASRGPDKVVAVVANPVLPRISFAYRIRSVFSKFRIHSLGKQGESSMADPAAPSTPAPSTPAVSAQPEKRGRYPKDKPKKGKFAWIQVLVASLLMLAVGSTATYFMTDHGKTEKVMGRSLSLPDYDVGRVVPLLNGRPSNICVEEETWSPFFRLEGGCYIDLSPTPEKICEWYFRGEAGGVDYLDGDRTCKQSDPRVRGNERRLVSFRVKKGQGRVLSVCSYLEDGATLIPHPPSSVGH